MVTLHRDAHGDRRAWFWPPPFWSRWPATAWCARSASCSEHSCHRERQRSRVRRCAAPGRRMSTRASPPPARSSAPDGLSGAHQARRLLSGGADHPRGFRPRHRRPARLAAHGPHRPRHHAGRRRHLRAQPLSSSANPTRTCAAPPPGRFPAACSLPSEALCSASASTVAGTDPAAA